MNALALVPAQPPEEIFPGATEVSLELPDGLDESEWRAVGEKLFRAHRASGWWIGDWINYGETRWGEKYDEAREITDFSYGYLRNCAMVARRFGLSHRCDNLKWTHHYRVAALPEADEWLARAGTEGWSVRELARQSRPGAPPPQPFEITTERQKQLAEAAKLRVEKAGGALFSRTVAVTV